MTTRTTYIKLWKDTQLSLSLEDNCRRFVADMSDGIWTGGNASRWYSTGELEIDDRFKELNNAVETALNWLAAYAGPATEEAARLETVKFIAAVKYDLICMVLKHMKLVEEEHATSTRDTGHMEAAPAVSIS